MKHFWVSTNALPRSMELDEALVMFAKEQIYHVELSGMVQSVRFAPKRCFASPWSLLAHNNMPTTADGFVINILDPRQEYRRKSIEAVCERIWWCAEHRIPFYSFHAGFDCKYGADFGWVHETVRSVSEVRKQLIDACWTILEKTAGSSVVLGIENMANRYPGIDVLCKPDDVGDLLSGVPVQRLGILLDTGHLRISSQRYGFDPFEFIRLCDGRLLACHINENDGTKDLHTLPTPSSEATMYMHRIQEMNPDVRFVVECRDCSLALIAKRARALLNTLPNQETDIGNE